MGKWFTLPFQLHKMFFCEFSHHLREEARTQWVHPDSKVASENSYSYDFNEYFLKYYSTKVFDILENGF